MKKIPILPLILISNIFQLALQQCIYSNPLTMSSIDQCSGQYIIDSTQSTFPSQWRGSGSTKVFSFDLQMKIINGECSSPSDTSLFLLQINDSGTLWTLLRLYYYSYTGGASYYAEYNDKVNSGDFLGYDGSYDININSELEFLAMVDLTYTSPKIQGYFINREMDTDGNTVLIVDPSWKFDSYTKIFLCSDADGKPNFYCSITSFNYWFTNPSDYYPYLGQLTPVLQASYLFGEGSGYKISDSANLGPAYLGASTSSTSDKTNSPTWLSTEVGIEFTSTTQYVNIKPFQLSSYSPEHDLGSFTISFWIRFTPNAGNGGNIFQYTNYDMSFVYFSLEIDNSGYLSTAINTLGVSGLTPVLSTDWTLIAVTFALHPLGTIHLMMISLGGSSEINGVNAATPIFAYNPKNQVRIGGPGSFLGSIYDLRIYSPGSSLVLNKASCSSLSTNCILSLGKLSSNQCLTKPAVTCHSSCKTCFDKTDQGCLSCYTDYHISYTQCVSDFPTITTPELSETTTETIKGSQKAAQAATQAVNAVTAGSPSGISAAIGGKIFFNIKFLNITYAENLEEALTSWGSSFISLGLTPDLPSSVTSQIPNEELPYVFQKRDVPSSFLENFWESLGMLLIVAFLFLSIFTLELFVKKCNYKYLPRHLLFAIRAVFQNFLLAQLYSVFGDMLFYASLEFRAPNTHYKWSRLSLASGIILLVFMVVILFYHVHLLLKYQYIRKEKKDTLSQFENENKGSSMLFSEFKDISFARQSFLLLLTGRDLIFSLFISLMFEHPLAECIFILVLNLAMVAYLLLLPPFKSSLDAAQQLFYEIITLAVNVSVLILAIMDSIDSPDDKGLRSKIGKFVIVINMVFNFGSLAFMLVKAFQTLYEVYQGYKERKDKQKTNIKLQAPHRLAPNENPSLQETNPKLSIESFRHRIHPLESIQFEPDQSSVLNKPYDQTNESFLINKEFEFSPEILKTTPKFETIPSSFDKNNQFNLQLDQMRDENTQNSPPNALEVSSFDNLDHDPAEALRIILRRNEETRKRMLAKKLKESSIKIEDTRKTKNLNRKVESENER